MSRYPKKAVACIDPCVKKHIKNEANKRSFNPFLTHFLSINEYKKVEKSRIEKASTC